MKQNFETMKTKLRDLGILTLVLFLIVNLPANASLFSDIKKENRNLQGFNEIALALPADLYLTQGSKDEVIIEADDDVLEKIETKVEGSTLTIGFEKWYNYRGTGKINVYVTVKDIRKLVLSGSGDIIAKSAIKSEHMGFIISGSGKITIDDLVTKEVKAIISGSGDIRLAGNSKANELIATVTGSGDFESVEIEFEEADFTITGSGSIRATVTDELDANITGSGKIYYKGKPLIDANITGSGKIKSEE